MQYEYKSYKRGHPNPTRQSVCKLVTKTKRVKHLTKVSYTYMQLCKTFNFKVSLLLHADNLKFVEINGKV